MKGDIVLIEEQHKKVALNIVNSIIQNIINKKNRYIITVAGESGSGKSETGHAIAEAIEKYNIKSVVLGQDDYFNLPPKSNDVKRREDTEWLGPHVEVKMDVLENNILTALRGKNEIIKPLIDYDQNSVEDQVIDLRSIKVVIAEGTYTSLLKNVDCRVFIARNRLDTLEHRKKRNRGSEASDPFVENILEIEHKIIAGHKHLADFIISKEYEVNKSQFFMEK